MRWVRRLGWLVLLVLGSLGIAGLVVSLDHLESGDARPELMARGAAIVEPRLAAIASPLAGMAIASDEVGEAGRAVLLALRAGDRSVARAALDAGDMAMGRLSAETGPVREAAPRLLDGVGPATRLSAADRARADAVTDAVAGADAVMAAWQAVRPATLLPEAFIAALARHGTAVDGASTAGRDGRYADALSAASGAAAALDEVRAVAAEALASGRPVGALGDLVARLAERDDALVALYAELATSGGVRTVAVDVALTRVDAARAALDQLPADLAGVVEELGGAELTDALLAIDDGHGAIEAARVGR